jgi:phage terminase large subunit-like protein
MPLLGKSPFADLFVPRLSNGSEALIWNNGSIHEITANTEKATHGRTIDLAFVDEAFSHHDNRMEQAIKPAQVTRTSPQFYVVSTAGTGDSTYLWGKVERGRAAVDAGHTDGVAYFEWSADPAADPSAPETWRSCMPALGHTITEDAIRADFLSMDEGEFRRAYLNLWTTAKLLPPIPLDAWERCTDLTTEPTDAVTFAVDVSPDRTFASVAVTSRLPDGRVHVELVDRPRSGVDWVVPWLIERWSRWSPSAVWLDPAGPAGSMQLELEAAGVKVETVTAREHGQACAALYDMVLAGQVAHRGDPLLLSALDAGTKRHLGDLWLWSRKSASTDITPAVALTLGTWGVRSPVEAAAPVYAF